MLNILILFGITLIPALELRASIPYGIFNTGIWWIWVFLICVIANIILGFAVFWIMGPCFKLLRRWAWFESKIWPRLEKTRHRLHPYVEKYGEMGVAVFIGIPLPGSGVYTGAFGAYLLDLDRRKFAVANIVGVLIAGVAVLSVSLLIFNGMVKDDSWIARLCTREIPHSSQQDMHSATNAAGDFLR